ncbi:MAG TPA: phage tail sheath subtilisin-like domain-containing protein [Actinomycetota bacterium]|jgi:hypothetical protein
MPSTLTYPGVYVEEVPSGVRTITGVATSITAFVGRAMRGPVNTATTITSYADFERIFGGLWRESALGYSVRDFYRNGGATAIVVRVHNGPDSDTATLDVGAPDPLQLEAASPGAWGSRLLATIDHDVKPTDPPDATLFNLTVTDDATDKVEVFRNVSFEATHPRYVGNVLAQSSTLVRVATAPTVLPGEEADVAAAGGDNGAPPGPNQYTEGGGLRDAKEGLYALEEADLVNLIVIPPYSATQDVDDSVRDNTLAYAVERDAIFILDPPSTWTTRATAVTGAAGVPPSRNAALYFPRVKQIDPLRDGQIAEFAPSGVVAGVIARTDATRGVWKAPAGLDATLNGVAELAVPLTDGDIGLLNPLGVNCLRSAPGAGRVIWGARTREGSDRLASEWKYLPVRRTALFLKVSLYRGTQWVVFEPNDEPLWAQIRLNVGAFLNTLFRQGAFAGTTPREAYFVKCDKETTTPDDVNLGIVNILVGFAPLKPAEFVVVKLQQLAGQTGGA